MTSIRSLKDPVPRRPGEVGIHSVDAFNFSVPDLTAADMEEDHAAPIDINSDVRP